MPRGDAFVPQSVDIAPEGYTLTAITSVEIVRKVLAGDAPAGFQTPSLAYGPDWILDLDGVTREDVE